MSKSTIGIKEALVEYLQDHVIGKKLTKRQIANIEKLFEENGKDDTIKSGFIIHKGDEINSFLVAILRTLNMEQKVVLRDSLIDRTPKIIDVPTELLIDAKNQIEYLQTKFQETGTGNAVISKIQQYLKSIK